MKLRIIIVVTLAMLVILFEVPKIKPAFETISDKSYHRPYYQTASTIKYELQNPPSARGWVLIHMITALNNLTLAIILFINPVKYNWLGSPFALSYILFGVTVLLEFDKLATLSMTSAVITNVILLVGLGYSGAAKRYDIYLAIMSIPVLLSTYASITAVIDEYPAIFRMNTWM